MQRLRKNLTGVCLFPKPRRWKLKLAGAGLFLLITSLLLLDWGFVRYRLLDEALAPAFWAGQKVVTLRTAYWILPPRRNDLIVYSRTKGVYQSGKLLAIQGDRIAIQHGKVVLNGSPVPGSPAFGDLSIPQITVPLGFVSLLPNPEELPVRLQLIPIRNIQGKILGNWQVLII